MEKLLRRELVYSVSETSLWGQFLLSLKSLKYEVRGRAADNPPEVDICKLLAANSTHLLPNTTDPSRWMRGPLFRAACSTTNFRAARPLHFTRAVVRREHQARKTASGAVRTRQHAVEHQRPLAAGASATPCPEIRLRGTPVEYDHSFCLRGRK